MAIERLTSQKNIPMKSTRIIVNSTSSDLSSVAAKLKKHGMKLDSVLAHIGVITGEIDSEKLESLRKIPEITVELEGTVQISPPNSKVQ